MRLVTGVLGCAAASLIPVATAAASQDPAPPPAEVQGNEIIVEGYTEKEIRTFLWRSIIEDGRVIAKRQRPVCIGIDNAPTELAQPLRQRIETNLADIGVGIADPGCKPNALIVFASNAHRFVNWLEKKNAGAAYGSLYLPEKRRLIKPVRPVYNWHVINTTLWSELAAINLPATPLARGPQAVDFAPGGRILAGLRAAETNMTFSVIDTDAIDGITIEQLGDYLTMQMLVEFRPGTNESVPADSILNLFTAKGADPDAAPGLSQLDRAILEQIYLKARNFRSGAIRSAVARHAVRELEDAGYIKAEP